MLSDRKRAFVDHYIDLSGSNGSEAARRAGYAPKSAGVTATHLLKNPQVLSLLREEILKQMAAHVPLGFRLLKELAEGKDTPASVKFQVAQALIDRGGLQLSQRVEHTLKDERTDEEVKSEIASLCEQMGIENPLAVRH